MHEYIKGHQNRSDANMDIMGHQFFLHLLDILCTHLFLFLSLVLHNWEQYVANIIDIYLHRLDIGDGKEVDLEDCPRLRLQQECIKYLGPVCFQRSHRE